MPASAFVVRVPAAESLVGELRNRFDATSQLGVPAHITVLYPFMPPDEISSDVLRKAKMALNTVPSFEFSLASVGRFATTAYLSPAPPEPFIALTTALAECFPMYRPYAGAYESVVPHLTVAHGSAENAHSAAVELEHRLFVSEPIQTRCTSVALLENSSGRWKQMHAFDLAEADQRGILQSRTSGLE